MVYIKIKGGNHEKTKQRYLALSDKWYKELLPAKLNLPIFVLNIKNNKQKEIEEASQAIKTSIINNRVAQVHIVVCRYNIDNKYEVLVLHRNIKKGAFWQTITGGAYTGEDFYHAACREMKEEIGIAPKILKYTNYHFNYICGGGYELNEYVYATALSLLLSKKIKISEEHNDFKWLSVKEAIEKVAYDSDKKAIRKSLQTLKKYSV